MSPRAPVLALVVAGIVPFPCLAQEERPVVAPAGGFGIIIDAVVDRAGNFTIADFAGNEIYRFDPDGELAWSAGRQGNGPGEFASLYRLSVAPSGQVLALDIGANAISVFNVRGEFLIRHRLPIHFSQVDNLLAQSDTVVLISGVPLSHGTASNHAIHRFALRAETADHLGSFAPLPATEDPSVLAYWGAGGAALDGSGRIIFTRKLPYEVYVYLPSGAEVFRFVWPYPIDQAPEDAIETTHTGGRTTVRGVPGVTRPLVILETPEGDYLGGRNDGVTVQWDLFRADGEYIGSFETPSTWRARIGFDPSGAVLWVIEEREEGSVIVPVEWPSLRSRFLNERA